MSLESGTRLDGYEITSLLGVGGMGEVYRARDTRLGRDVAIKTLPAALAGDTDRLARFEREAKLLASLNHAHIASVYGLDEHEGMRYIAMELVEGASLEEKLKRGPLNMEDSLQLGLQIALALEAAHEKGVVHRDLKPANVMVTPDGVAKVLDFGLAKAFSADRNEASLAHSPALSLAMTQQGLVLGTAGYMSPEQASGQTTDQRADVWAFGVVLYEMLTGLPLFSGESVPHVLAEVLKTEPDWTRLPKALHPRIRQLLERCLTKKPRNRWHSIADARIEIEGVLSDPGGVEARSIEHDLQSAPSVARRAAVAIGWIVLGGAVAGTGVWWYGDSEGEQRVANFVVAPPAGVNLDLTVWAIPFALSPNGRDLVFVGKVGATRQLYIRPLEASDADARPIPGTERALHPFWSPDSEWVAFFDRGDLKRARVAGGAPTVERITDNIRVSAGWGSRAWGENDQVLVGGSGIERVAVEEGTVTRVLDLDRIPEAKSFRWPAFVGDGSHFLFVSEGAPATMYVASLAGDTLRPLMDFTSSYGSTLHYVDGKVFYVDNGVLWARSFDAAQLEFSGEPRRVLEGIPVTPFGSAPFSISASGFLAYRTLPLTERVQFRWFDRDGTAGDAVGEPIYIDGFDLSRDGKQLAYGRVVDNGAVELWYHAIGSGSPLPLVRGALETVPRFSSDGEGIVFTSRRTGDPTNPTSLYTISLRDRSQTLVTASSINALAQVWNASDDQVIYAKSGLESQDLWVKNLADGSDEPLPVNTDFAELFAALSPDGRLLAFTTNESGLPILWIATYPDGRRVEQVSRGIAIEPAWNEDGAELFYIGEDRLLIAVAVETTESGSVRPGPREPLFRLVDAIDGATQSESVRRVFAVAPGGRFLVATHAPPEREPLKILIGWDERLEGR